MYVYACTMDAGICKMCTYIQTRVWVCLYGQVRMDGYTCMYNSGINPVHLHFLFVLQQPAMSPQLSKFQLKF